MGLCGVNKGIGLALDLFRICLAPIICSAVRATACSRSHQGGRAAIHWHFSEIQHGKEAADWVPEEVPGRLPLCVSKSRSKASLVHE